MSTIEQWAAWGEEQQYYSYIVEKVHKPEEKFCHYYWQLIRTEEDKEAAKQWVVDQGVPRWIIRTWLPFERLCEYGDLRRQFAAFWHPQQKNDGWAYGFMQRGELWVEK